MTTSGYSELNITSSTIVGSTRVNNTSGGPDGDTKTVIDNSWLQRGAGPAFTLTNGNGADINNIRGNSQFGIGPYQTTGPVVLIINGSWKPDDLHGRICGGGGIQHHDRIRQVGSDGLNLPGFVDLGDVRRHQCPRPSQCRERGRQAARPA